MGITNGTLIKRGRVWWWKYRLDKRTEWESLGVERKRDAEFVRQERIAEYRRDTGSFLRESRNPEVEEFEREYFAWAEQHKRESTIAIEKNYWRQLLEFTGAKRLGDVRPRDIERFKSILKRKGMRGRPLADESINDALRHLQAIYNHALKLGLFNGTNPVLNVARFKIPKSTPDFLSQDEIGKLLLAAEEHSRQLHWVCLLGIYCGLRKKEIVCARWEWFDFENKLLRVRNSNGFEIKDSEERSVPLSSRIHEVLGEQDGGEGYLLTSSRPNEGKYRYRYDPRKSFATIAKTAGVPRATFQLMRHTFGSQHAIAGTSIYKISKWMGHSSVDVTAKHYAGLQEYDEDIDRFG